MVNVVTFDFEIDPSNQPASIRTQRFERRVHVVKAQSMWDEQGARDINQSPKLETEACRFNNPNFMFSWSKVKCHVIAALT